MNTKGKKNIKKVTSKNFRYKAVQKNVKKKKVRRIRYGRIILCIILPICFLFILSKFIKFPVKNIYVSGNSILSDQEIIELAGISDYPSMFDVSIYKIEKKLETNKYINNASVKKKHLKEVYIKIEENIPILYYAYSDETIFNNKNNYSGVYSNTTLLNYTPTDKFNDLIDGLILLSSDVRSRISEIQYIPNDVDDDRFLLTMNDGNYVYITLTKIELLDSYIKIVKEFVDKKGILYLDSGEYFEIK